MNDELGGFGVLETDEPWCGIVVVWLPDVACIFGFEELVGDAVDVSV